MSERSRRKPKSIGDVMPRVLSKAGVADRVAQAAVVPEWSSLVGPQIAKATRPLHVTPQGTLFVAVKTNAWMTELSLLEPELLQRLNRRAGRLSIKKIRWQLERDEG